jgi:hypothetical protein
MRSPNYPALTLPQAVEAARKVWAEEQQAPVSHEAAAADLGYKSLSGPARVTIGAMRQYGLVEKAEKGHLRLSDLAVKVLHGTEAERVDALAEAASTPPLFGELAQTYVSASEGNIRSYLITKKKFSEDGARKAARAFKESIALATTSESGYTDDINQEKPKAMAGTEMIQTTPLRTGDAGVLSLKVPYGAGALAVEIRVSGEPLKRAHIERVRKYLELAEADLPNGPQS